MAPSLWALSISTSNFKGVSEILSEIYWLKNVSILKVDGYSIQQTKAEYGSYPAIDSFTIISSREACLEFMNKASGFIYDQKCKIFGKNVMKKFLDWIKR